ncbi:MAG TPA: PfkB family carbohydrate kinase [Solirubrobacteraceae bacterium]|nr:PfkB family carbohydrate kinase [Solirubrobacteraceae bacterium]
MRFDYTAVGHVTVDVMADGSRRPGGGAFYSALQAARVGLRTRILTRGVRAEIDQLLEPYREELSLDVLEAPCTTTLATSGHGRERSQRVLAWAGEIGEIALDTQILHLAPVARETDARTSASARAAFVGVTPQGLVRDWSGADGRIVARKLDRSLLPEHCDALVLSEAERDSCAALLSGARDERASSDRPALAGAAVIAVTHGEAPTELRLAGGVEIDVEVPAVQRMCDDIGAGDVFAAAFFIALADGEDAQAAAQFANAAAAVRVAAHGAGAIGDRAAIEARLASVA